MMESKMGRNQKEMLEPWSMGAPENNGIIKRGENKQRVPNRQTHGDSSDMAFSPALFAGTPFYGGL